ncbi:ABC transporter permease [Pseudomonas poae]|uniref:ABC transporter permease n=1 Tax=Pseudomonas poae TaxID=200451 RepID=A0A2S9EEU8_9PSED|nr:ABC transporter permease [Pseudomonas poae]PRA27193.1 ABC transporter permease [Pseudomonas poae]PRC13597.1 ABC transporter permease [Pseudomonas poae]
MNLLPIILKRQLVSYACAPATYLSVALFLGLSTALGLHMNPWLEQDSGDLQFFFQLHPWLYLLLTPALATQLWSDESDAGFLALVKILPITTAELVIGKFMAAWIVSGTALILMFPLIVVANYLGDADNSVIASQFMASWLLAGSYVSCACLICTIARQRAVIFSLTLFLLLAASGLSSVLDALEHQAPIWAIDSLTSLSPLSRFNAIDNGKFTLSDSLYFISMIFACLTATIVRLNYKHS